MTPLTSNFGGAVRATDAFYVSGSQYSTCRAFAGRQQRQPITMSNPFVSAVNPADAEAAFVRLTSRLI